MALDDRGLHSGPAEALGKCWPRLTRADHAMGAAVHALDATHDNVHMHVRYSRPRPGDVKGHDYDSEGRVDIALLKELLPFDDYEFYLCGPPSFMKSLYCGLIALGVADRYINC